MGPPSSFTQSPGLGLIWAPKAPNPALAPWGSLSQPQVQTGTVVVDARGLGGTKGAPNLTAWGRGPNTHTHWLHPMATSTQVPALPGVSVTSAPGLGQATIVSLQDLRNSLLTSLLSSVVPPLAFPQGQISQRYPTVSRGQACSPPLAPGSSTIRPCPLLQPPLLLTPEPLTLTPVGQNSWLIQYMNQISPCASHGLSARVRLQ